jgi:hypothetical protein
MSVTSETEICNLALGHLGEARITSLEEDSTSARACSLHYEATRDAVLRSHRWNFAQARAQLPRLQFNPPFGWDAAYQLPGDCLRVLEVNGTECGDVLSEPYIIEGRAILINAGEVRLVYVRRIEDPLQFDSLFIEAFALKLAIALSETIRGTTGKTEQLFLLYDRVTAPLSRRVDANEGRRRKGVLPMNSPFVRSRFGAYEFGWGAPSGGVGGGGGGTAPPGPSTLKPIQSAELMLAGEASFGALFGFFVPYADCQILGIDLAAQDAPEGAPGLAVQLLTVTNDLIGPALTLLDANFRRIKFADPISVAKETNIRARIDQVGSVNPGAWITLRLAVREF